MALAPAPQPIGIFAEFIASQTETLVLKEHVMSLSGDSFSIKNTEGQAKFQVKGDVLSLSGRKHVTDMSGKPLFDIRKEHLTIHSTYYCEDPQGQKIFEVKSGFAVFASKATATFTSANGKAEKLLMKGNWLSTSADIIDESTGMPIARIERKLLSGKDILFGQQTYNLIVAQNVDMALMVAMCIALDEKKEKK